MIAHCGEDRNALEVFFEQSAQMCNGFEIALSRVVPHIVRVDVTCPDDEIRLEEVL